MRTCFLLLIALLFSFTKSHAQSKEELENECSIIQTVYLKEAFQLTKNAVGFSAPVSARAYAYINLGMYECGKKLTQPKKDFSKKLTGYTLPAIQIKSKNTPLLLIECNFLLYSYFYRSMPPSNASHLKLIRDSLLSKTQVRCNEKELNKIMLAAQELANHIISYSKSDGADDAFMRNYPEEYKEKACLACWTRTNPGYFSALLPYWGNNRYFIQSNKLIFDQMTPPAYTSDTISQLYHDAKEIEAIGQSSNPEFETIAEYWDDSPGFSGTPSGHFFNLAQSITREKILKFTDKTGLYLALGIALNDAFIACWHAKYTFNFLRPITYIHRFINPNFNSRIASPSFPEYPSGHSMQSGAGSQILNFFIGNTVAFTDSTNLWRKDINGAPRSFENFDTMALEISNSRIYGGIHFRTTANNSLQYGKLIGINTLRILTAD